MRPAKKMAEGTAARMWELLRHASDGSEIKRIQCIYFRARYQYTAKRISEMTGYNQRTVRRIQSAYLAEGEKSLALKKKGGRYRENMSIEEEKEFLAPFLEQAKKGGILEVGKVHRAYAEKLGREVKKSVVYALLHRHGWRKIAPRPRHPQHDEEVAETFKKTSELS
jgi:transposase